MINQFVKLTRHSTLNTLPTDKKVLVNISKVTDIYSAKDHSTIYFESLDNDGEQIKIHVKESLTTIQKRIAGI